MSFENFSLDSHLVKATKTHGFLEPTPIQAQAIPLILKGKDLMAAAQTGTGKTAAFLLPALHNLTSSKASRKPRLLVLAPTRELANQITTTAYQLGKNLGLKIANLIGGEPYHQQLRTLSRHVDIIIATPGRLLDHLRNNRLDLSGIETLVLDEADRMLDMGFFEEVEQIIDAIPKSRQSLLFSATISREVANFAKNILRNPVEINLVQPGKHSVHIEQTCYLAENERHKLTLLHIILSGNNIYKAIIFCATKAGTDKLAEDLVQQGYSAAGLHGDLRQHKRNRILEKLRSNKIQILVATDVAARGIDISDITHVINFDFPKNAEDYVHRIGRTGRAGKTGIAISFILHRQQHLIKKLEKYTGEPLKIIRDKNSKKEHGFSDKRPFSRPKSSKKKYSSKTNSPSRDKKPHEHYKKDKSNEYPRKDKPNEHHRKDKPKWKTKKPSSSAKKVLDPTKRSKPKIARYSEKKKW